MTKLALKNPIAVLMLSIAVLVFSAVVTPRMPVDTFPELTPPSLVVGTLAPGLGPKDVEKTLTWRIEKYVGATPGVDHVESISKNNMSIVYVWLRWGSDLSAAQTLVQQQVNFAMAAVPKTLGIVPPFVLQYDPSNAPVVQVVVSGGGLSGPQLYDWAFNNIQPVLEGIPGVASAAPSGGRQRQINVVVDPVAAQARGITATEVSQAVAASNALLPSGAFLTPTFNANVYTNGVPDRVRAIGDATVKIRNGKPVYIRDVAQIEDGGTPETQGVTVNGQDAVTCAVMRVPGGNTLEIVDAVNKVVKNLKDLPPGMEVRTAFDQSTFVRSSYHGLKSEIIRALVLIAIVILLFLQSVRGTVIVSIAIPLSFAVTLIGLYATGQTLNAFTLGGLTLAMGRLIDDAVVVLEAIHQEQEKGKPVHVAALDGAQAVALPVLASTLTTMAVLLPVLLLAGLAKKLFAPLALTVAIAMAASYIVSLAVTPVACRYFMGKHVVRSRLAERVHAIIARAAERYASFLGKTLPRGGWVIAAAVILTLAALGIATRLPASFFPEVDESIVTIYVRQAPGTSLEEGQARLSAMGETLRKKLPAHTIDLVYTNIGTPNNARSAMTSPNVGPHTGFIQLGLVDTEHRTLSQREVADASRRILRDEFPGTETLQSPGGLVASVFLGGYPAPLVMEVRSENLAELEAQARAVADVARTIPGIADVRVSLETEFPEVRVDTTREQASLVGLSPRAAAQTTLEATLGNINQPSVWIDPSNGQTYFVVTQYDNKRINDLNKLSQLAGRVTEDGKAVPLGAYGSIRRSVGPIAIERNQLQRAARVLMQTERRDVGSASSMLEEALEKSPKTAHIKRGFVGQTDLMRTTFSGLGLALAMAVMVVYMLMAAQFRSLKLPLVMLGTVPVALVGIVMALLAASQGLSIVALMGVLMVIGISVSNGILLVDDAEARVRRGAAPEEAIVQAARSRFVPILMTSLATVVGLVPTALGIEAGTESNQPLALAVVGGLTSSTVLSLFLVPVLYLWIGGRIRASRQTEPPMPDAHHPDAVAE
jgi:CzcA family heavy metal efflux pump